MEILFLSHCVPNPPDKGEKIRAWHELNSLAGKHRVHLACFGRSPEEVAKANELRDRCASVFAAPLSPLALARAAVRFAVGDCLNTSYYRNTAMRTHIETLKPLSATLAYSSAVVQFAPKAVPLWLDLVDVDSEKWLEYGRTRWPGALYALEGRRFRRREAEYATRAERTFVTTPREQRILEQIAPRARVETMMNGVDFEFFDPEIRTPKLDLGDRRYLVFVGQMDYFPNVDACCWFAENIFGELRSKSRGLEFLIVGRNPSRAVQRLGRVPGVAVTGGVSDVRPYLAHSLAMVAPLRIARGVQNKVLEALAMGKRVLVSPSVASTFGTSLPLGVALCESASDYVREFPGVAELMPSWDPQIRQQARLRFSWEQNLQALTRKLERATARAMVSP
jgi:sugar transferase (PEP-CTERM/EpsH1 system associated)